MKIKMTPLQAKLLHTAGIDLIHKKGSGKKVKETLQPVLYSIGKKLNEINFPYGETRDNRPEEDWESEAFIKTNPDASVLSKPKINVLEDRVAELEGEVKELQLDVAHLKDIIRCNIPSPPKRGYIDDRLTKLEGLMDEFRYDN